MADLVVKLPPPGVFGDRSASRDVLKEAGIDFDCGKRFFSVECPAFDWIVEGLLAAGSPGQRAFKGDLVAGSKGRKSFFAIQLGLSVATGRDVCGYVVPKPRKVVYLNLELVERGFQERVYQMVRALGLDCDTIWRNFTPLTIPSPTRLRDGKVLDAFIARLKSDGYELVIIDPQYKLYEVGEDESTGVGLSGILRFRDRIINESPAAVLMVMHDSKGGSVGDRRIADRGAGSGFAGRDYDARFTLTPHADGDEAHVVLSSSSRYRAPKPDVTLVFDQQAMVFQKSDEIDPLQQTSLSEGADRAQKERERRSEEESAKAAAAIEQILKEQNGVLLDTASFCSELSKRTGIGINRSKEILKACVRIGTIFEIKECRLRPDGSLGDILHARNLLGTEVAVKKYLMTVRCGKVPGNV